MAQNDHYDFNIKQVFGLARIQKISLWAPPRYDDVHIAKVPLYIREKAQGQCGPSNTDIYTLVKLGANDENQAA